MADAPVLAEKIEPAPDNTQVTGIEPAKPEATSVLGAKPEEPVAVLGPDGKPVEKPAEPTKTEAPVIDPAKLTLPEGFKADEPTIKAVTDVLLDDKLAPQDRMQKLVDIHTAALKASTDATAKYWSDKQTEWQTEAKKVYGPEPAKSPKIIAVSKLIDSLGEKPASELRDALEMSGMGNHPAIIGAFVQLAEKLTETGGTIVATKPSASKPSTIGDALYGPQTNSGA